jgi:uncharacterized membrane protein (Fun14 family)
MDRGTKLATSRTSRQPLWVQRVVVGALLGSALFLVEAGIGQVALGRDAACREAAASQRLGSPDTMCMSELGQAATRSLGYGPGGRLFPEGPTALVWGFSAALYSALGAACALLTVGWAVGTFLSIHAFLVGAVAFFTYVSRYITF